MDQQRPGPVARIPGDRPRYRVLSAFTDFDGDVHPPGEEWTFLGTSFLPYDDGLSIFVSLDGVQEWQIRMQWRPDTQGAVLDVLRTFVGAADQ